MGFNEIIGQEIPKRILQAQIREQRIATSYLFYGPEGVGKTLTAKIFAKTINCKCSEVDSCDKCEICIGIDELKNPDFIIVATDGKSKSIGIDKIRAIKLNTSYCTVWLNFRVIIIKEADTLTEEAANAFLKILEEAPRNSIFILTTSKIEAILPTVKSRCQLIEFRRLKSDEIKKLLPNAPEFILRLANGSVTRAIKLMHQETQEIRDRALQFFKADAHQRIQLIPQIIEIEEFLRLIQEVYMDLLRKKLGNAELIKNTDFTFEKELQTLVILKAITTLEKAYYALSHNVHKKLILYWLANELP